MNNISKKTVRMVQLALFAAIVVLLAMIPGLGYIPVGAINATTIHIPVIIGSILLGPIDGAILGFVFGCTSLINATFNPGLTSFVFSPFYSVGEIHGSFASLIVCFIPRILIGVVPYFVFKLLRKALKNLKTGGLIPSLTVAGVAGSLTNTILVMGLIYILFGAQYAQALGVETGALLGLIMTVVFTNGIIEAIVAAIIATAVCRVFFKSQILSDEVSIKGSMTAKAR
ncbi:Uncharacterized membrane protein [Acetitomaculum ruminis DSM 5522]|uniref:Uncharacterized membrane protein n=1 Tax=Acetitomaculum ruminis DSM 5522 TaxID=1120918 RepID=A0A1I0UXJ0_9FIRM|nr:ECF transporter S component [Acetitomaculum ruminis]SFA68775.1 Uncharacterized membrane protein [Acetitomaculum ruminis DSM 5522]